jgi:hypothetical protein
MEVVIQSWVFLQEKILFAKYNRFVVACELRPATVLLMAYFEANKERRRRKKGGTLIGANLR